MQVLSIAFIQATERAVHPGPLQVPPITAMGDLATGGGGAGILRIVTRDEEWGGSVAQATYAESSCLFRHGPRRSNMPSACVPDDLDAMTNGD